MAAASTRRGSGMIGAMVIDLHTHSSASDGTDSPAELVAAATAAGIDVLAVTDHDTTAGWDEAFAARPESMTIVPGTEFSCVYWTADNRRIGLHLLGYLYDPTDAALRTELVRLRESRLQRGRQMVENMAADGIPVSWPQVSAIAGGGVVGRPHIGQALVESGVVPDVNAAFRELLSSRQHYYVRKVDTDVFEAIRLVRAAGGLPVFAHPLARRRGPIVSDEVIARMTEAGLVGIEVDHPDHDIDDRAQAAGLAADLGLIATGSSDYHGTNKPTRLAACTTGQQAYESLLALPSSRRPEGPV